jgi:hypothetical protein
VLNSENGRVCLGVICIQMSGQLIQGEGDLLDSCFSFTRYRVLFVCNTMVMAFEFIMQSLG